ncbi:hypothetical protein N4S67_23765 [Mycobacterium sp. CPCC 205710]|uniref:Uncharacterized protein n=1 Tax=Mycobacterium deserti TaxID=2978347 RepID=A0ABT2MGL2_9MYCO|nr:hypothetical protein [Mycobacterium deserti]MCT7661429.1 hypothetical protein [Mycobacterium deserti]
MQTRSSVRPAVVVGALGVVFGDIGTQSHLHARDGVQPGDPHPVPVSAPMSTGSCR